jgi:hypothetical protein
MIRGQVVHARKKLINSRADIGQMNLAALDDAVASAELTPHVVTAHFSATIPSCMTVRLGTIMTLLHEMMDLHAERTHHYCGVGDSAQTEDAGRQIGSR